MEKEEMEKLMKEAISNGEMEPNRLFDAGLQFVVPILIDGGVNFLWFDHADDICDYISC